MPAPIIDPSSVQLVQLQASGGASKFVRALDACVKVDLKTGAATVDNGALEKALGLPLKSEDAAKAAKSIAAFLSQGYFVAGMKPPVFVPWGTVQKLIVETSQSYPVRVAGADLGLDAKMSVDEMQVTLQKRGVPKWLSQQQTVQQVSVRMKNRDDDGGFGPDPGHKGSTTGTWGGGSAWTPPPPLPDAQKCLTSMGTWSANWWGVMLCVDGQCAQSLADAIDNLTIGGSFTEFGKAVISAAVAALSSSSLAGFCVAVALAFTGGVLKIWIETENDRGGGNGVCIRFYWPYLPFIGGMIEVGAR